MTASIAEVTGFWIDAGIDKWFEKSDAFDDEFRARFLDTHLDAARRKLDFWAESAEGALALMILLDQFPRNCFRGTAHMYATDPLALRFARAAIAAGHDRAVAEDLRIFFYLPLMHSEVLAHQEECTSLCGALGEEILKHAVEHRDIVARFGRFPHRNPMFARDTTADELAFLDGGGFAG